MRDSEVETGYLSHERLSPEEIASIETALRSRSPRRPRRRPARWLGLAAAAAMIVAFVFMLARFPSQPTETFPVPSAAAAGPRAMVLEIQRTDLADSKPYTLIIQLDSEVQP
jgi:hypothetical protein